MNWRIWWTSVVIMAAGSGMASWAIADHQVYLVPVDCFTFAMGVFSLARSTQ